MKILRTSGFWRQLAERAAPVPSGAHVPLRPLWACTFCAAIRWMRRTQAGGWMGVAVAPFSGPAASERKICNLCHRAAAPLVCGGRLPPQSARRQTGNGPGLSPAQWAGLSAACSTTQIELPLQTHCGDISFSSSSFFKIYLSAHPRRRDAFSFSPHEGRMTPAHLIISSRWELPRAAAVSPWRPRNSPGFSRIWKGTKSDPCSRWVRRMQLRTSWMPNMKDRSSAPDSINPPPPFSLCTHFCLVMSTHLQCERSHSVT